MIKGLSERRRLPRLGKIHLGVKKTKRSGNREIEYPSETDYFVVPSEVAAVFGEKPKALKVMFPVENAEVFFQQWYKMYGSAAALKCKGDGETATAVDEKTGSLVETKCPCAFLDEGKCKQIGILQFLLPDIPGAGVWQITTSSKNSIIDINSSIDFIRAICGRIRMIPLILKREALEVQRIEGGASKKSTHYTLKLDLAGVTLRELQQAGLVKPEQALLPPPDETRDTLFFPEKDEKSGFAPEESAQEEPAPSEAAATQKKDSEKTPEDKEAELIVLAKKELEVLVKEYIDLKKVPLSESLRTKVTKLKGLDQYRAAIDWFKAEAAKAKKQPALPLK